MSSIYSYVVRYDSGFAPNPFYGYCTLATCKPNIRKQAQVGDWVVGCASNARGIRRGGHLVYAMRVTETMSFDAYSVDPRFEKKKPFRKGSRKQSCGDNIYFRDAPDANWQQRDSFHSLENGMVNLAHIRRDTGVNRVIISDDFVYFGGNGPKIPSNLKSVAGKALCHSGRGSSLFDDFELIQGLEQWIRNFQVSGYQESPYEWITLRR